MKLHMPITSAKVKTHFHYHLWKYLLLAVLSIFGWNLLFTVTQYRVPEDRKLEFYADGTVMGENAEALDALMAQIHADVLPDMEEVSYTMLDSSEMYGQMQLVVWATAKQGDVYLLQRDRFIQMAQGGAMVNLQPYIDDGTLQVEGLTLSGGKMKNSETGEASQWGIPADGLAKLSEYGINPQGAVLSVLAASGNEAAAVQFLNYLLISMR